MSDEDQREPLGATQDASEPKRGYCDECRHVHILPRGTVTFEGRCYLCEVPFSILHEHPGYELLRPYQRQALADLIQRTERNEDNKVSLYGLGIQVDEAHTMRADLFRRYPKLQELLDPEPHPDASEPNYYSDRGNRLTYTGAPGASPVLTCELYTKWYGLYLVEPDGSVRMAPIELHELEEHAEGESVVGDHCWNPSVILRLCADKNWRIDDLSFDLLVGRWHTSRDEPESTPDVAPAIKVYSECPRRFEYRMLKRPEGDGDAAAKGREIHEAMETLDRHGVEMVAVSQVRARKMPPRYSITGKKDVFYLEHLVEDQWEPFDSLEEAEDAAWEDFDAIYSTVSRHTSHTSIVIEPKQKCSRCGGNLGHDAEYIEGESAYISTDGIPQPPEPYRELACGKCWRAVESDTQKVSFALRLAKVQSNYQSNVEPEVQAFLASVGIEDIYNPPNRWTFVTWKDKEYLLSDLEDSRGYVTGWGLALDWPAKVPDEDYDLDDEDPKNDLSSGPR